MEILFSLPSFGSPYVSESKLGAKGQPPIVVPMELGVKGLAHKPTDITIQPRLGYNQSPSDPRQRLIC